MAARRDLRTDSCIWLGCSAPQRRNPTAARRHCYHRPPLANRELTG